MDSQFGPGRHLCVSTSVCGFLHFSWQHQVAVGIPVFDRDPSILGFLCLLVCTGSVSPSLCPFLWTWGSLIRRVLAGPVCVVMPRLPFPFGHVFLPLRSIGLPSEPAHDARPVVAGHRLGGFPTRWVDVIDYAPNDYYDLRVGVMERWAEYLVTGVLVMLA